jgi:hypothetical protein
MPQKAGAALRFEPHCRDGFLHLLRAFGFRQHQSAHTQIELGGDVGVNRRLVEFRCFDEYRVGQTEGRLAQCAGRLQPFHQFRECRKRALHAAFHAAVEDEIGLLEGDRLCGQLRGGFLRPFGCCGGAWRTRSRPAVARRVETEDGLFFLE